MAEFPDIGDPLKTAVKALGYSSHNQLLSKFKQDKQV